MRILNFTMILLIALTSTSVFAAKKCTDFFCKNYLSTEQEFDNSSAAINLASKKLNVVKIVYKRKHSDKGIYFINMDNFSYHYDFTKAFFKFTLGGAEFNKNYDIPGSQREFNLASLVEWSKEEKIYLLEIWSGDTLDIEYIKELRDEVKKNIGIADAKILFHPLSLEQEKKAHDNKVGVPFVKTSDLFKNQTYIPLNQGTAYGYVKFINPEDSEACLDNTNIAVYSQVPNEIGLVGGVVTEDFQTPLSHINVKSINRNTVNFSLKDAKKELKTYKNKPIKLDVFGDKYKATLLDEARAKQMIKNFWSKRKPKTQFTPSELYSEQYQNSFIDLEKAFSRFPDSFEHELIIGLIGAKATNIALLNRFVKNNNNPMLKYFVPKGYGIPFNFYNAFMNNKQVGLDPKNPDRLVSPSELVTDVLNRYGILNEQQEQSICVVKPALEEIRTIISKAETPKSILNIFKNLIMENKDSSIHISKNARIRLRSSTNSEDMEGFSGAGLYNSAGVWLYNKNDKGTRLSSLPKTWKEIEKKLKKKIPFVYSSVWNDRAFEEREWYSINGRKHLDIKVGVAVHRAFPAKDLDGKLGEAVNGVAITTDVYDQEAIRKVYINSQHYDLAVTNPPSEDDLKEKGASLDVPYRTEEILITTYLADYYKNQELNSWLEWPNEVLSRSSIKEGEFVLKNGNSNSQKNEVNKLAKIFKNLNSDFARIYKKNSDNFILDIEWKLIGPDRELWIKQARPFNQKIKDLDSTGDSNFATTPDPSGYRTSPPQNRSAKPLKKTVRNGPRPPGKTP